MGRLLRSMGERHDAEVGGHRRCALERFVYEHFRSPSQEAFILAILANDPAYFKRFKSRALPKNLGHLHQMQKKTVSS